MATCPHCQAPLVLRVSRFVKLVIFTLLWASASAIGAYFLARYKPIFSDSVVQGCDPYSPCRDGIIHDYIYGGIAVGMISGGLLSTIIALLWPARR